jgi:hypothetical protein
MATVAPLFSMLQPLPPVGRLLIYLPQRTILLANSNDNRSIPNAEIQFSGGVVTE